MTPEQDSKPDSQVENLAALADPLRQLHTALCQFEWDDKENPFIHQPYGEQGPSFQVTFTSEKLTVVRNTKGPHSPIESLEIHYLDPKYPDKLDIGELVISPHHLTEGGPTRLSKDSRIFFKVRMEYGVVTPRKVTYWIEDETINPRPVTLEQHWLDDFVGSIKEITRLFSTQSPLDNI